MGASEPWVFGLVGEVIEHSWIVPVWVLECMNGAVEEKVGNPGVIFIFIFVDLRIVQPKSWKELQVGIERAYHVVHRSGQGTHAPLHSQPQTRLSRSTQLDFDSSNIRN